MLRFGLVVAGVTLALDQLLKWLVTSWLSPFERLEVAPFLDLLLVHNRGISFGLFQRGEGWAPWLLGGLAGAVAVGIVVWLTRVRRRLVGLAAGLVLGGAVGNLIDRARFGAVIDFIDAHAGGYHWPAFNLADAAISAGVALLVLDALLRPGKRP